MFHLNVLLAFNKKEGEKTQETVCIFCSISLPYRESDWYLEFKSKQSEQEFWQMNILLRKSVLASDYQNSVIFFGAKESKTVYSGKWYRPAVWSRGQGWDSNNNQVKEGCVKPGGGHCLSQQPRNWNIPPCVNVEVNELSSVLCCAWKNSNAVLTSFLKANPKCHSVSALWETVTGGKKVNIHRLWEMSLKWKKD